MAWCPHPLRLAAVGLVAVVACRGTIGGTSEPEGPPPPPDVTPRDVPATPETLDATTYCTTLAAGERLASVSPEGHAWILGAQGEDATEVRIVDPLNGGTEWIDEVVLTDVVSVRALDEGDAGLIAGDALWRLDEMARIALDAPDGFDPSARMCGDPRLNGALLSGGSLLERRPDGQWWAWRPEVEESRRPTDLVAFEGECIGSDDAMWLTGADGTLWRVGSDRVTFPIRFEDLRATAATGTMVAAMDGNRLWVGPEPWQPWVFSAQSPTSLSAADGYLWMAAGDQVLRFDGETFVEVRHDLAGIEHLEAHAGGAWIQAGADLCHLAPSALIRVRGIRPYARVLEDDVQFSVADVAGVAVSATLDGEPVTVSPDPDQPGWSVVRGSLSSSGWHVFNVTVGDANRGLTVRRQPSTERSWEEDIRPLYETNCTGGMCHGGSNADLPALDTYEAWVDLADTIEIRVVEAQTMPPASSRRDDWPESEQIVAEWLNGGRQP